jgi:DNA-binding MarR family transcriptional regulator
MRGSAHSREFRTYEITATGVQLGESLRDYDGIISGMPTRQPRVPQPAHPGLTEPEVLVLQVLIRSGPLTPAEIAKQTGVPPDGVERLLDRLVELLYASHKAGRYTAEARPSTF